MELCAFADVLEATRAAGARLNAALLSSVSRETLFLSAGGSALSLLEYVEDSALGAHLVVGVSDERFGTESDAQNFTQLCATDFYRRALRAGVSWIDARPRRGETLAASAERYEATLKQWHAQSPDGAIVITQGIGEDGHTAGIMPFPENPARFSELFENPQRWVIGYGVTAAKNPYPQRVTVTPAFLRSQVSESIAYAAGEEKRAAVERVVSAKGEIAETPARVLREMRSVSLCTTIGGLRVE